MNRYIRCIRKALNDDNILKKIRDKKYKMLSENDRYLPSKSIT